jgi:2'-5' RNA ligase
MQAIGLGMALVPTEEARKQVQEFVSSLATDGFEFAFALHTANSIPHLSLMQAVFDDPAPAIELFDKLDCSALDLEFRISDISVWATRVIFLNFQLPAELKRLHVAAFNAWHSIACSGSADPQTFVGITAGQQESFRKTGYPFGLDEYLPHITLAHLKEAKVGSKEIRRMNRLLEKSFGKRCCSRSW